MKTSAMSSRYLLLLVTSLALAGCAVHPKSRQELLAMNPAATRICTGMAVPDAASHLRRAWRSCFAKSSTTQVVPLGTTVGVYRTPQLFVGDEFNGARTSLFLRMAPGDQYSLLPSPIAGAILLMADIQETAECRAEVVVRPASDTWSGRAAYTPDWFRASSQVDEPIQCP